jgi:hypothetical protein
LIDTTVVSHLKALRGTAPEFKKKRGKNFNNLKKGKKLLLGHHGRE